VPRRKDAPPLTLSPDKWANLNEAFHQARARLGYDQPTERDLTHDLRNGDLIGATREILRGQETVTIRPKAFWKVYRVVASRMYDGATIDPVAPAPHLSRGTYVFIRRDGLDNRYPREVPTTAQPDAKAEAMQAAATEATAAAGAARAEAAAARAELEQARAAMQAATERMEKAEARAEAMASEATTKPDPESEPRRRPGPKLTHPDWRLVAAAFSHTFFKKNKRMPSAGEVAEHLQIKYDGWEPHESDISKLLRFLSPG
jgi:hypothetical protein